MTLRLLASICLLVSCASAGRDNPVTDDGPAGDASGDAQPDGNNCATQPCDILTQCGCLATQACDIDDSDVMGTACRNVAGNAEMEGGSCSNTSGCVAGNVCLSGGICRKYCDDTADCGQPRGQCIIAINNNGTPIPDIPKTCSSNCDPTNVAAGGGCPAAQKCSLFIADVNGVDTNIVDCDVAGSLNQGGNCEVNNAANDALCSKDHLCTSVDANSTFQCRRMCVVGGAAVCGGLTCLAFNPPFTVGGINYGVCN
ncbi:MAG: hypothetical protein H0V17_31145 [Deltaproteobacteria bacterium]|nr:hypothetical protein [Deltaproteobacteria bacterium]